MKLALAAYFSCIAATLNFDVVSHTSNKSRKKPVYTPNHVEIKVDVDEVNPYTGRPFPTRKYTQKLPLKWRSSSTVEVDLTGFLKKFSKEPVKVHYVHVESPTVSSGRKGKVDGHIKTLHAKNKNLQATMTATLVNKKGNPQDYKQYKRNIATRAGYFVAATATSMLLIPVGIILTPACICFDWIEKDRGSEGDCCYNNSPCRNTWGCLMYPQRHLWSKVFTKKGSRDVVVKTTELS